MFALLSVWLGLACLVAAIGMVVWRGMFTDGMVFALLWLGAPGALWLAGMSLWAHRKRDAGEPGVAAQRLQCKVAIGIAILAAGIVYLLIIKADEVPGGVLWMGFLHGVT